MADHAEPFPPPAICSERVLHYALLDDTVGYNCDAAVDYISRNRLKSFEDKEFGKAPCLAICQGKDIPQFIAYYCDSDWELLGLSVHDSVAAAKTRAEHIYPGSSAKWVVAHFTDEDVERHLEEIWADSRCSFCGKRPDQGIESMIEAPSGNARICDKCIAVFSRK
jgi:hypothetical protein